MAKNPQRIYLRLIDNPLISGSSEEQLEQVRRAVEGLEILKWDDSYPQVSARGGWDIAFYVANAPDAVTFDQWLEHLSHYGLHPCI